MVRKSIKRDPQMEVKIHVTRGIPFERMSDKIYNAYVDRQRKTASKFGEAITRETEEILTGNRLKKIPDKIGGRDWDVNGNPNNCIEHKNNKSGPTPAQKRKKAEVERRGGRYVFRRTHIPNDVGDMLF